MRGGERRHARRALRRGRSRVSGRGGHARNGHRRALPARGDHGGDAGGPRPREGTARHAAGEAGRRGRGALRRTRRACAAVRESGGLRGAPPQTLLPAAIRGKRRVWMTGGDGVAGARGAGHHLVVLFLSDGGYQSGEEINLIAPIHFCNFKISDKSPFPNLKRRYTLASAGQLVAVVPLKNTRSLSPSCSPSKWLLGDTTCPIHNNRGSPIAAERYTPACEQYEEFQGGAPTRRTHITAEPLFHAHTSFVYIDAENLELFRVFIAYIILVRLSR